MQMGNWGTEISGYLSDGKFVAEAGTEPNCPDIKSRDSATILKYLSYK